jgi:DNA-binding NtrC family response regulator
VDYRLPDSTGIALIIEMTTRFPRLRAILMTSYGGDALRTRARESNVFAYFDKPFSNELLVETVELGIRAWETGEAAPNVVTTKQRSGEAGSDSLVPGVVTRG